MTAGGEVEIRVAGPSDIDYAEAAAALIEWAADAHDIAVRAPDLLENKIKSGRAALALDGDELVGFGYWSDWDDGKFVSHSGLVVRKDHWGMGLGRRLKEALYESSRARFPGAALISLTNSPQVKALNVSLGFVPVEVEDITDDPAFWEGCKACRNFAEVQARGDKCCCEAMILKP